MVAWYVGTEWLTQFAGQVNISVTEWLTQFAGQVNISVLHFAGLALLLLVIIVCIVVLRAWRIANENPVKSIKSE